MPEEGTEDEIIFITDSEDDIKIDQLNENRDFQEGQFKINSESDDGELIKLISRGSSINPSPIHSPFLYLSTFDEIVAIRSNTYEKKCLMWDGFKSPEKSFLVLERLDPDFLKNYIEFIASNKYGDPLKLCNLLFDREGRFFFSIAYNKCYNIHLRQHLDSLIQLISELFLPCIGFEYSYDYFYALVDVITDPHSEISVTATLILIVLECVDKIFKADLIDDESFQKTSDLYLNLCNGMVKKTAHTSNCFCVSFSDIQNMQIRLFDSKKFCRVRLQILARRQLDIFTKFCTPSLTAHTFDFFYQYIIQFHNDLTPLIFDMLYYIFDIKINGYKVSNTIYCKYSNMVSITQLHKLLAVLLNIHNHENVRIINIFVLAIKNHKHYFMTEEFFFHIKACLTKFACSKFYTPLFINNMQDNIFKDKIIKIFENSDDPYYIVFFIRSLIENVSDSQQLKLIILALPGNTTNDLIVREMLLTLLRCKIDFFELASNELNEMCEKLFLPDDSSNTL